MTSISKQATRVAAELSGRQRKACFSMAEWQRRHKATAMSETQVEPWKARQLECNKNNWFNFIVNSMRIAMQKKQFHSVVTLYQLNEIKRKNFIRGQAKKSTRWMPWHWEPTKDVISCDKPRWGANIHWPADFWMGKPGRVNLGYCILNP